MKPSKTQWNPVKPNKTHWNPVKPSKISSFLVLIGYCKKKRPIVIMLPGFTWFPRLVSGFLISSTEFRLLRFFHRRLRRCVAASTSTRWPMVGATRIATTQFVFFALADWLRTGLIWLVGRSLGVQLPTGNGFDRFQLAILSTPVHLKSGLEKKLFWLVFLRFLPSFVLLSRHD